MEDFSLPAICCKLNTAERRQSGRLLEYVEENFLSQLVREPARSGGAAVVPARSAVYDREKLVGDAVIRMPILGRVTIKW